MSTKALTINADNILNSYNSGTSIRKIAASTGTTTNFIKNILLENGCKITIQKTTRPETVKEIINLFNSGLSQTVISNQLNVAKDVVCDILKRNGVKSRTRSEQHVLDQIRETGLSEQEVIDIFLSGIGISGIYAKHGFTVAATKTILAKHGINTRNRSEQQFARLSITPQEERDRIIKAAHDAIRGTKRSKEDLFKRALTIESRPETFASKNEVRLAKMLGDRGIKTIPQKAIGSYNCDLAAFPVVVEVFGGHWHWTGQHLARAEERINYILNQGWSVLMVADTDSFPITNEVADYIASYIENARTDPSFACEYRVIWGAAEYTTSGGLNDDNFSIEPPFTHTRDATNGQYITIPK